MQIAFVGQLLLKIEFLKTFYNTAIRLKWVTVKLAMFECLQVGENLMTAKSVK